MPPPDAPDRPGDPSYEAIARLLGIVPGSQPPPGAAPDPADDGGLGPVRLDKDGILAGHGRLAPRRAHGDGEPPARDASSSTPASPPPGSALGAPRKAALPPRLGALRPDGVAPPPRPKTQARRHNPRSAEMIPIPGGVFPFGEEAFEVEVPPFEIDRYPVTNRDYEVFVEETGHRPPLYWTGGHMPEDIADHPVVGVDYFDGLAYARWVGKDLPFEDEWERAARGTDARPYPWGEESEISGCNTARSGVRMTTPVDLHGRNVSPDGVCDMVGNAWELTHSPAAGGGVVVRGGSWYDFALYAKTFFRFATDPDARNGTIGLRCVRRAHDRDEEPREVDPAYHDSEIAARTGAQVPTHGDEPSAERRDLVVDSQRLRRYVEEMKADALFGPLVHRPGARASGDNPTRPAALGTAAHPAAWLLGGPTAGPEVVPAEADAPPEPAPEEASPKEVDAALDVAFGLGGAEPEAAPESSPGTSPEAAPAAPAEASAPRASDLPAAPQRLHVGDADARLPGPAAADDSTEPDHEPEHVPAGAPSLGLGFGVPGMTRVSAPPPVTRPVGSAVTRPSSAATARPPAPRRPESMPLLLWLLLGAGFLLFGGLLVSMLSGPSDEVPQEGVAEDAGRTPPSRTRPAEGDPPPPDTAGPDRPARGPRGPGVLDPGAHGSTPDHGGLFASPNYGQGARDGEPPRVLDGNVPEQLAQLGEGTWVLVFLDPDGPAGMRSITKAHQAHRALVERGIEVALVVPREAFEGDGGWLLDERALRTRLREFGAWDGIHVVLDPVVGGGDDRGRVHTAYGRKGRTTCGAVVHHGGQELRLAPRDREGAFELDLLATMADKARTIRGD